MDDSANGLSTDGRVISDFGDGILPLTEWYGLARTFPAVLDDCMVRHLQQKIQEMGCMVAQVIVAQEVLDDIFIATLFHADRTIEAMEQIKHCVPSTSKLADFEAFHRTQRSQLFASLAKLAHAGANAIHTEFRDR